MDPIEAARRKANQTPRPLTPEQAAIVAARNAETAAKLSELVAAFAKPERKRTEPAKSKQSNGWTR
jgi:hypothetical protein